MMDVTEHPTAEGKVYVAVVLDGVSRMVVAWSIADHIRAELVVGRRPAPGGDGRRQTRPWPIPTTAPISVATTP